jgi:hypothetical protein
VSAALDDRTSPPTHALREIRLIDDAGPAPDGVVVSDRELAEEQQVSAERGFWSATLVGALIGMVVCAGLWVLIVAIALVGAGWSLGPPLLMAAGIGVFAGAFLGGWAGAMVGAAGLERTERELEVRRHG